MAALDGSIATLNKGADVMAAKPVWLTSNRCLLSWPAIKAPLRPNVHRIPAVASRLDWREQRCTRHSRSGPQVVPPPTTLRRLSSLWASGWQLRLKICLHHCHFPMKKQGRPLQKICTALPQLASKGVQEGSEVGRNYGEGNEKWRLVAKDEQQMKLKVHAVRSRNQGKDSHAGF